jgi:hypothetical protein
MFDWQLVIHMKTSIHDLNGLYYGINMAENLNLHIKFFFCENLHYFPSKIYPPVQMVILGYRYCNLLQISAKTFNIRGAVKKFPEWWYSTLILPNHLQSRTFAHAHTHTCSIDPAIVGSSGGRLLLESSGARLLHLI